MKHQSIFFSLTRVVIILTAAFFFGAQADDKKGGKDPRAEKFRAAEEEIWGAVKAGKLSKEDAMQKIEGLKKKMFADHDKKDWDNLNEKQQEYILILGSQFISGEEGVHIDVENRRGGHRCSTTRSWWSIPWAT